MMKIFPDTTQRMINIALNTGRERCPLFLVHPIFVGQQTERVTKGNKKKKIFSVTTIPVPDVSRATIEDEACSIGSAGSLMKRNQPSSAMSWDEFQNSDGNENTKYPSLKNSTAFKKVFFVEGKRRRDKSRVL